MRDERRKQNFAAVSTIRAAIFDVIDGGDWPHAHWEFYEHDLLSEDGANQNRTKFVGMVLTRIQQLQNPPHDGIRLENFCPRHLKEMLPPPSVSVCAHCKAEERASVL